MQLKTGTKLQEGLFEVTGNIATGGFSYIYSGTWNMKQNADVAGSKVTHVFQLPVVIKELYKNKLARRLSSGWVEWSDSDSEIIKRKTLSEARKLNAIDHPNVLKVYATFEENNSVYIVTKPVENAKVLADIQNLYIKSQNNETGQIELFDNPASCALPLDKVKKYTRQLCEALSFVHESGILHLDVKPDNILLDVNDNIVLIDFGISVSLNNKKSSDFVAARTKHYSPPEQGTGKSTSLSYATDVYALGATVYVFLTGKEPPDYEEQVSGTELLQLPSAYNSELNDNIDAVLMRAMDMNRSQRYQTVEEFYTAFVHAFENNSKQTSHEPYIPTPKIPKHKNPSSTNEHTVLIEPSGHSDPPKALLPEARLNKVNEYIEKGMLIIAMQELAALAEQFPADSIIQEKIKFLEHNFEKIRSSKKSKDNVRTFFLIAFFLVITIILSVIITVAFN